MYILCVHVFLYKKKDFRHEEKKMSTLINFNEQLMFLIKRIDEK